MPQITVLPKEVAELIAAGEVIDRPASVAKELIENAIDAKATAVTVEIQRGGVSFLRVTDNGCGMAQDQVATALLRHATSKVTVAEDLEQIVTLGFRGEALASISAVSHLEIFTCEKDVVCGTHLVAEGGVVTEVAEAGCGKGTTILVRDLFYNVPARLKFLKTDSVEGGAVGSVVDAIALSHPEISFRFLKEGKEVLHTPGDGKLQSAVYAVLGREFTKGLLPVDYTLEKVRVYGFITKPETCRPNRRMQHFFLNGRYVKCRTAMAALEQGYKNTIMAGKFPGCVLHLSVNCRTVDVNVHPTKLEVRFVNERPVFDCVYHGVKTALQQKDMPSAFQFSKKPSNAVWQSRQEPLPQEVQTRLSPPPRTEKNPWQGLLEAGKKQASRRDIPAFHDSGKVQLLNTPKEGISSSQGQRGTVPTIPPPPIEEPAVTLPEKEELPLPKDHIFRIVGEVFATYCVIERDDDTLLLVDKHAAHERLLYEQLKQQGAGMAKQQLLEPVLVTLGKEEYRRVLEQTALLEQVGFVVEDFGEGTLKVETAPLLLEGADIADTVAELAGQLWQHRAELATEEMDWIYHNVACRAAIKAGKTTSNEELLALVQQLADQPEVRHCPHGRPIFITLTKKDLEKQFGRIQ